MARSRQKPALPPAAAAPSGPIGRIERSTSLVTRVEQMLREAIAQGQFADGKLPTEVQLAEQLGVSRETVRRATETLASEGLLVKFRRKGTFLAEPRRKMPERIAPSTLIGYVQADYRLAGGAAEPTLRYVGHLMLDGALEAAGRSGYELVVQRSTIANLARGVRRLTQAAQLGGIVFASVGEEKLLRRVAGQGLPMVLVDHDAPLPEVSTIRDDSAQGAQLALEHLASLGHRRIAIAYWHATDLNPWRLQGYREALRALGLPRQRKWEILTDLSPRGAEQVAATLSQLKPRPTAVYCFNNSLALMVGDALGRVGLEVPRHVSVVGGGGQPFENLTHHRCDWHAMGRQAIEILVASITAPQPRPPEHRLQSQHLHVGGTTGPCES